MRLWSSQAEEKIKIGEKSKVYVAGCEKGMQE